SVNVASKRLASVSRRLRSRACAAVSASAPPRADRWEESVGDHLRQIGIQRGREMRSPALIASSFAALLLTSSIARADGSDAKYVAPPPFSWTGMYLGYHSGAAFGSATFSDPFGPSLFGDKVRTPGGLFGIQAGANGQSGSTVFGIELDLSASDLDGTN